MQFRRRDDEQIERELRQARPEARRAFVDRMVARVQGSEQRAHGVRRGGARRLALSGAFSVLVLGGIAAGGGVGYAAHIVAESASVVKTQVFHITQTKTTAPRINHATPSFDQYGNPSTTTTSGGGGGAATTTTTAGTTTSTPPATTTSSATTPTPVQVATGGTVVVSSNTGGALPQVTEVAGGRTLITGTGTGDTIVANVGNLTIVVPAGDNTIHVPAANNVIQAGPGNDLISLGTGNQTVNAGAGDNNIHVYGTTGTHKITTGDGDQTIRLYGGTNIINATGTGTKDINIKSGTGRINVDGGGGKIFTASGTYTIDVSNGKSDTVNCGKANDTVIVDAGGLDKTIHCGNVKVRAFKG